MSCYICMQCSSHFDHFKVRDYDSETGYETHVCPSCGSEDFEEAGHCIKCGDYFPLEEMCGSICKTCIEKRMTVHNAYRYGWRNTPEDGINDFVNHSWSPRQASEELLKSCTPEDAKRYVSNDLYDFSEWLEGQEE